MSYRRSRRRPQDEKPTAMAPTLAEEGLAQVSSELLPDAESSVVAKTERITLHDRLRLIPDAVAERLVEAVNRGGRAPEVARILLAEIDAALEDFADAEVVVADA